MGCIQQLYELSATIEIFYFRILVMLYNHNPNSVKATIRESAGLFSYTELTREYLIGICYYAY